MLLDFREFLIRLKHKCKYNSCSFTNEKFAVELKINNMDSDYLYF